MIALSSILFLFLGLFATGAMVAYSDFKKRLVNDALWVPALAGAFIFYWSASDVVIVYVFRFVLLTFLVSSIVYLAFRKKGFGGADSVSIIIASLFPFLLLSAVLPSMIVSYIGIKLNLWGGAGTPLAGWIGFFSAVTIAAYVIL